MSVNNEITKIVITGGPCAGKTTALERIRDVFTPLGYTVVFIPETATELISSGIAPWTCITNSEFQHCLLKLQLEKERIYTEGALLLKDAPKILLVCDRGAMDNKAYIKQEEFSTILSFMDLTEFDLLSRYHAVFHLTTAANGSDGYTLENNNARYESASEAIALDDRLVSAWQNHAHHVVIENSSSFEEKIDTLIEEISAFINTK